MDFAELCRSMNLISTLPEYTKPKNVGLMFFSLEPEKFFPYAQIDVVQFPDDLGGDQIIEKTFKGPLHQQLREALQYIRNSVLTERVQKLPDVAEANRFFNNHSQSCCERFEGEKSDSAGRISQNRQMDYPQIMFNWGCIIWMWPRFIYLEAV